MLNSIPLYGYTTLSFSTHSLTGVLVVFILGLCGKCYNEHERIGFPVDMHMVVMVNLDC